MSVPVFLNRISTAVPPYEVHSKFLEYAPRLIRDERERKLFSRLASKAQIERRYSVIEPAEDPEKLDAQGFFRPGAFPTTARRMQLYERSALPLAARAVRAALEGTEPSSITHLIVTSCTGFYAPGLDLDLQREFNFSPGIERSIIGFMGCYAAFQGLKAAWHAVRSMPNAKVLLVNLELCTIHMQEDGDLEQVLAFMQFADGCAASLISADPVGLELESFRTDLIPDGRSLITWHVGDHGFKMYLASTVPQALGVNIPRLVPRWLDDEARAGVDLWAVHPGGRSIIDAVGDKLRLSESDLRHSRAVLREHGNMSSATIVFVLERLMRDPEARGRGVAMAFGPGMTMESMVFKTAARA